MSEQLRVHYKVGDIEFDAEGSADDVEKQRKAFMSELLPEAVNAVIKTHSNANLSMIKTVEPILISSQTEVVSEDTIQISEKQSELTRESLASFCNSFGNLADQDFLLAAAYFDEKKNNVATFSAESIRRYYQEARRPEHSNLSQLINRTIGKGYIMDAPKTEGLTPKQYVLTANGIRRVENKELNTTSGEKKPVKKAKKVVQKTPSVYSNLCLDDLNLKKYPDVRLLPSLKQQVIMVMYIVTNEAKGDFFSIADVQCLVTDLWGLHSSSKTISNIFTENKSWFKVDTSFKEGAKRKLLEGAKDYARKIIGEFNKPTSK